MHMDIDTNMKMVGKRFPHYASYTVSFGTNVVSTMLMSTGTKKIPVL